MNFLAMCQFVQAQIGTSVDLPWAGPTTVVGQSGQYLEIVNWVQMAYKAIQEEQPDWLWRWKKGTLLLTTAQAAYTRANIVTQLSDFEEIKPLHYVNDLQYVLCYDTTTGVSDQTQCLYIKYQDWRGWKDRNTVPTGKPQYFTVDPSGSASYLEVTPTPTIGNGTCYTLTFDYRTGIDTMTVADATSPLYLPTNYHEAICWKAIMYWSQQRENGAKYQAAKVEYDRIMNRMRMTQLPETDFYTGEFQ